ncbi:MAG: hypothetical protein ACI3XT_06210 [Butyricicoccaceae bacterium]
MKRQKHMRLLAAVTLLFLLAGCAPEAPSDTTGTPDPAPIVSQPSAMLAVSNDIDWNDLPETWTGTGGSQTSRYLRNNTYLCITGSLYEESDLPTREIDGVSCYRSRAQLTALRDKTLQADINQKLQETFDRLEAQTDPLEAFVTEEVLACDPLYRTSSIWPSFTMSGNLLSAGAYRFDDIYAYDASDGRLICSQHSVQAEFCTYDLATGRQLTLSDLFVDGTDLNALLNPLLSSALSAVEGTTDWIDGTTLGGLIRPFRGLPVDYPYFSLSDTYLSIFFPTPNPYIAGSYTVDLPLESLEEYLAQPAAASTDYFDEDIERQLYFRQSPSLRLSAADEDLLTLYGQTSLTVRPYLIAPSGKPAIDAINADLREIYRSLAEQPLPAELSSYAEDPSAYLYANSNLEFYRGYVHFSLSILAGRFDDCDSDCTLSLNRFYDRATGQPIPLSAVLRGPDDALAFLAGQGFDIDDPAAHYNWYSYTPSYSFLVCAANDPSQTCEVPVCYFNIDFFTHS